MNQDEVNSVLKYANIETDKIKKELEKCKRALNGAVQQLKEDEFCPFDGPLKPCVEDGGVDCGECLYIHFLKVGDSEL